METYNSGPEFESGEEILVEVRERLLEQAFSLLNRAKEKENERGNAHTIRMPLEIPDVEDVMGIMLTRDGERPFQDEDKEHIMLLFPDFGPEFPIDPEEQKIWIKEHITDEQENDYVLSKYAFQPRAETIEEFGEVLQYGQNSESSEMNQLSRFRERFKRYDITPFT